MFIIFERFNFSCLTQNAKDYRVMHPFSLAIKNDTRILSAEIYGFMFNTDNEITFVCTIKICKTSTPCVSAVEYNYFI